MENPMTYELSIIKRIKNLFTSRKTIIVAKEKSINKQINKEVRKWGNGADLNRIDVSNINDMGYMFHGSPFNGDISLWDVGNVINMSSMFWGSKFNGDISNWNIENLESNQLMFYESEFEGDLNKWKPRKLTNFITSISESPLMKNKPVWYLCLHWDLFKSGDDYCDSLRYDWLRGNKIVIGRLKIAIRDFGGDDNFLSSILGKLKNFEFQN